MTGAIGPQRTLTIHMVHVQAHSVRWDHAGPGTHIEDSGTDESQDIPTSARQVSSRQGGTAKHAVTPLPQIACRTSKARRVLPSWVDAVSTMDQMGAASCSVPI